MKKMKASKKFRIYKEIRREFISKYPISFPVRGKRPPLKVGILKDILKDNKIECGTNHIRIFLSIWTRSTAYLQGVAKKRPRVTIQGDFSEDVKEQHAKEAYDIILIRKNKKKEHLTSELL